MTFRTLNFLVPACAALVFAGFASAPASAAPLNKAAFESGAAQLTLVDHRDGRWRGDRGRDRGRQWRGRDDRHYSRGGYRPYYPAYRVPRYVYTPPAYYYPYDDYYYRPYVPYGSTGYFSYSSPNLGLSFGY